MKTYAIYAGLALAGLAAGLALAGYCDGKKAKAAATPVVP